MSETIGYDVVVAMLRGAIESVNANHALLGRLDSHGGDGDHGTTMVRAMKQVAQAIGDDTAHELKPFLDSVGWAIMGVDGGATGPLLGTLFMSMGEGADGVAQLDAGALATMLESGLAGVRKRTKAQVGDKTMMDALTPAVEAARAAADAGEDLRGVLAAAADAAQAGAEKTKELQARFGRAKHLGEGSIGEQDPGATSTAFIFRGFLEGVTNDA